MGNINVRIATTDTEIGACYTVMRELRPDIGESEFLARVRRQEENGYRLVCLERDAVVVAVAGFRISENLAWGRFLYIDDLVTSQTCRSQGLGRRLLSWIREFGRNEKCAQVHLDSGLQRADAHRFYEREGMERTGFHFAQQLAPDGSCGPTLKAGRVSR